MSLIVIPAKAGIYRDAKHKFRPSPIAVRGKYLPVLQEG
jgi:hypothetical protein